MMTESRELHGLLVDDDVRVLEAMARALRNYDVTCEAAKSAEEARTALVERRHQFDVVLLDIDMPGKSGLDLLDEIRKSGDVTPVIFVTGFPDVDLKVRGLRSGADDYVVKPFAPGELFARIEAVVRRGRVLPEVVFGGLCLDLASRAASLHGRTVALSAKEFDVLRVLMEARGKPVSRSELLRRVWEMEFDPETAVVEVLVSRLRRKLSPRGPSLLETIPREGYRIAGTHAPPPPDGPAPRTN